MHDDIYNQIQSISKIVEESDDNEMFIELIINNKEHKIITLLKHYFLSINGIIRLKEDNDIDINKLVLLNQFFKSILTNEEKVDHNQMEVFIQKCSLEYKKNHSMKTNDIESIMSEISRMIFEVNSIEGFMNEDEMFNELIEIVQGRIKNGHQ